jgi:dipeptidyl aminopeptidase/acylaminoacyl peptidase
MANLGDVHETVLPAAPAGGTVRLVKLSPDAQQLAYVVTGGDAPGIYAGARRGNSHVRLLECHGYHAAELAFSPTGRHLAYRAPRTSSRPDEVGWFDLSEPPSGQPRNCGRLDAVAFGWQASGKGLVVYDAAAEHLTRVDVADGSTRTMAHLPTDVDPIIRPFISSSPDGAHMVFTTRDKDDDISRVFYFERGDGEVSQKPFTAVPGADVHVVPFWSPKGMTLALYIVHLPQKKSAVVAFRRLEGDGEVLYESGTADAPLPPAWSPDGSRLAVYRRSNEAHYDLVIVSLQSGLSEVLPAGQRKDPAELHFIDPGHIAVDGVAPARILALPGIASSVASPFDS